MNKLDQIRRHFAALFAAQANSTDSRIAEVVASTPREDFVGAGPWIIVQNGRRIVTPTADPAYLYADNLVALDEHRNNGEPFLHAAWIGKVAPKPFETVSHIGAGTGYYTAMLAKLVSPGGRVIAFEIDEEMARRAAQNLETLDNVTVIYGDGVKHKLPGSDIVYVNAGVVAPPAQWLRALRPGGRMVFPWAPVSSVGLAALVTRKDAGFAFDPFMGSWFIPCVGASIVAPASRLPTRSSARNARSIWLIEDRQPDDTAIAIIGDVWFSREKL